MQTLCFPANQIYIYHMTGKFEASSDEWMHPRAPLSDYELFAMTKGILYLKYGEERFTVREGEYLLLPPSESFRQGFKPSYCAFYWLHFSVTPSRAANLETAKRLYHLGEQVQNQYYIIPSQGTVPKPAKLTVLLRNLLDQVHNDYPASVINISATSALAELWGQLSAYPAAKTSLIKNQKQIYMEIMNYININVEKKLTVSEISEYFGYNRQYLSNRFKEMAGVSLKEYILQQKLEAANSLLTDTNMTVTEIALRLGFSNVCNFSRTYKQTTGFTPVQYRESYSAKLINND